MVAATPEPGIDTRRPFKGVYVRSDVPDSVQVRAEAAFVIHRRGIRNHVRTGGLFDIPATRLVEQCRACTHHHSGPALVAARYVRDEHGRVVRRLDLSYPAIRLIVEYDGRQHIEREANWERDLGRCEELDEGAWRILVFTAKDIYGDPARTIDRVHRSLRSRGCPGLPRKLSERWRSHFPGHG